MYFETERLIVRDYCPDDFKDYYEYIMDPELQYMLGLEGVTDEQSAFQTFNWLRTNRIFLALEEKRSKKVIGHICLHPPYSPVADDPAFKGKTGYSLSFAISFSQRRKGYMEEALKQLIHDLFQLSIVDYFDCEYTANNTPSCNLQKKLGFQTWRKEQLKDGIELIINVLTKEKSCLQT